MGNIEQRFSWEPLPKKRDIVAKIDDVLADETAFVSSGKANGSVVESPSLVENPTASVANNTDKVLREQTSEVSASKTPNGPTYDDEVVFLYAPDGDLRKGEKKLVRQKIKQTTGVVLGSVVTTVPTALSVSEALAGRPAVAVVFGIGTVIVGGITGFFEFFRRDTNRMLGHMKEIISRQKNAS